jgi:hypothetical protein
LVGKFHLYLALYLAHLLIFLTVFLQLPFLEASVENDDVDFE